MTTTRKQAREAFKQLLIDENVIGSSKVLLGKHDNVDAKKLPVIHVRPAGGSYERSSVDSYEDTFNLTIEVEVRKTLTRDVDTALEDYEEAIIDAIRTGSATLNALLLDYQVINSGYTFEGEGKDQIGNASITVEAMLKP